MKSLLFPLLSFLFLLLSSPGYTFLQNSNLLEPWHPLLEKDSYSLGFYQRKQKTEGKTGKKDKKISAGFSSFVQVGSTVLVISYLKSAFFFSYSNTNKNFLFFLFPSGPNE